MDKEILLKKFRKVCINRKHVYTMDKGSQEIQRYLRTDLAQWAREFAEKGEKYFYTEPVNPDDKYGELRLCEPKYKYVVEDFTVEEYDELLALLNSVE